MLRSWAWNEPEAGDDRAANQEDEEFEETMAWSWELLDDDFGAGNVEEGACRQAREDYTVDFSSIREDHTENDAEWSCTCEREYQLSDQSEVVRECFHEGNTERAWRCAFVDADGEYDVEEVL